MNYNNIIKLSLFKASIATLLAFASAQATADGWDMFGQQDQMKNYFIVDVGEVSKVNPPPNTEWNKDVYRMNGRCFMFSGYMGSWGYGKKAALLLVNAEKSIQLALIEPSIGATKVTLKSIEMIQCP